MNIINKLAAFATLLTLSSVGVASGQNLLTNPGFEDGSTAWTTFGAGWRTNGGADAYRGKLGMVDDVLPTQNPAENWRGVVQTVPASAGQTFVATVYIRTVSLKVSVAFLEVQFLDAANKVISQNDSPAIVSDQAYTKVQLSALTAPAGTKSIGIRGIVHMLKVPSAGPEFHTFDDFDLERTSPSEIKN